MTTALPFLTEPDPLIAAEGALDPLGLATVADRLAEHVLPGLRARMERPRFLTAMAVAAAVCKDLDEVGKDGVTPRHIVFEWLLVEAFARARGDVDTIGTPGILKARGVCQSGEPMRASAYLRAPSVFGFHGIYKPIAVHTGIVDHDLELLGAGYALLEAWEREQELTGFVDAKPGTEGDALRRRLREAVQEALKVGCTTRKAGWIGWESLARHLAPAKAGLNEAAQLHELMLDSRSESRAEVFRLIRKRGVPERQEPECDLVRKCVLPRASVELRRKIEAIEAFESFATAIEAGFDHLLFSSSQIRDRPTTAADFERDSKVVSLARGIPKAVDRTESALGESTLTARSEFSELAKTFGHVSTARELFTALLERHAAVQKAKKPDGKREWFERDRDEGVFVRPAYRIEKARNGGAWGRPYRFTTVRSFTRDLLHGKA